MDRDVEGDTKINGTLLVIKQNSSTLMPSSFSNICIAHNFEPACQGRDKAMLEIFIVPQHSIFPKTDLQTVRQWLDVDITSILFDGGDNDSIGDTNYRFTVDIYSLAGGDVGQQFDGID